MNYDHKDRELNLKSLVYSIARRWRQMLVAALVLALALGGYRGWGSLSVVTNPQTQEALQQAYEANYGRYLGQVETLNTKIAMVEEDISQQGEYLENSVLMQIDHRNAWLATLSVYVQAENDRVVSGGQDAYTLSDVIADAYRAAVTDSRLLSQAAEELGIEVKYLRELISTPSQDEDDRQKGPLITVVVRGRDEDCVDKTVNALLTCLDQLQGEVRKSMGKHTVNVVSCSATAAVDEELADIQKNANDRLLEYTSILEDYQFSLQQIAAPMMPDLSVTSAVKSMIKYAVVGFLCGVFLVAVWGCVCYVAGDKVYAAEELKSRFGLTLLGKAAVRARKRCCIDRWLDRIENRGKTEEEGAMDVICANVSNHCPEGTTLLVAGTAGDTEVEQLAQTLSAKLPGRTILWGGSLLDCVSAIQGLSQCDGVVLVERCGISRYSLVKSQVETVLSVNKRLIGCVTLEK